MCSHVRSADDRNSAYKQLVNSYYELATLFYEVGWGSSFHFAYRMLGESFSEGIRRCFFAPEIAHACMRALVLNLRARVSSQRMH